MVVISFNLALTSYFSGENRVAKFLTDKSIIDFNTDNSNMYKIAQTVHFAADNLNEQTS